MNNSNGRPGNSDRDSLPFPVVNWYNAKKFLSSSSLAAPGLSILLPKISTGQLDNASSVSSESSSFLLSWNRLRSQASIKNTIASTAGK
jgi:hypothetical protein